jgi:lipoyl(octanoyl) transferase
MQSVEWRVSDQPVPYDHAVAEMEARAAAIRGESAPELVWLLEHPALFTAGSSAQPADLLDSMGLPVIATGRGGQYTYHGPGQRIAYVMLDLKQRGGDVRAYVDDLENWLIKTLGMFGVRGEQRPGRVGVWVQRDTGEEVKIAAIGVRIRRWVSYHGVSLNIAPNLANYQGIVACGIREHGVTSLADLGIEASMDDVDAVLRKTFGTIFG